jgi:glutamyl-tRNA reductase
VKLILIGLSHQTAPVGVRERHSVASDACPGLAEKLVAHRELDEAAIVSTCNRTELFAVSSSHDSAAERLFAFLRHEVGDGTLTPERTFEVRDAEVARHLFRVSASLDSMVLGEAQILGQIKESYRMAVEARACGPVLNRMFQSAFRCAKRVRSQTGLGASPVSVARIGVQLASEIFESLSGKAILLLGAGEMAESAAHGLREAGADTVVVVNRSPEPARRLADRLVGRAASLEDLPTELETADVMLASLAVDSPVIGFDMLADAMWRRQGRPLLIVDLGIPRNVDPQVGQLKDVYTYDLDDLEQVAERGRARRAGEVPAAEQIVTAEVERFERWREELRIAPAIRGLLERAGEVARSEALRAADHSPEAREALERLAQGVVAKLLHRPLERLRAEAAKGSGPYYADAVRALFGQEEDE